MNCKFCQAELEDGNPICPACGKDNTQAPEEPPVPTEETAPAEVMEEPQTVETSEAEAQEGEPSEAEAQAVETPETEVQEAEAPAEEPPAQPKRKTWKIVAAAGCVVLLLALGLAVFYGINGGLTPRANDVKYKDSYTVEDAQALKTASKTVATLGDSKLTNGQLQIYYWMQVYDFLNYYGGYASFFGLDYTQPLDTQVKSESEGTWQQYFLDIALDTWRQYQSLALMAKENGYQLEADLQAYLDAMPEQMEEMAASSGYESADAMIQAEMGAGCTLEDYSNYLRTYYEGLYYFSSEYEKMAPTAEEIEAYFAEHEADFAASGITRESAPIVDVRHILIMPQGGTTDEDGNVTYSDEEMEACRASAEAILDEWLAGEATEDSFAALANTYSEDGGSNANGGLYTDITEDTSFVQEFLDWCFEEGRQVGDYGLIQTQFGWHIMYFSASREAWFANAQSSLLEELSSRFLEDVLEQYTMEVKYKNIAISNVDLS